jgi:hypothetical protein
MLSFLVFCHCIQINNDYYQTSETMDNFSLSTISNCNESRFNILNPEDYEISMKKLSKNENLLDLIRKGFQLNYKITRGLQFDELEEMIQSEHGSDSQFMLKQIQQLSEGQSTWLGTTIASSNKRDTILVHGSLINEKYDVLNVRTTQIKQLNGQKLLACGVGSLCAGALVSSIFSLIAGLFTSGSILAICTAKTVYDYRRTLPDVIYGYIFNELMRENVVDTNVKI